jgi:hypothetical protein
VTVWDSGIGFPRYDALPAAESVVRSASEVGAQRMIYGDPDPRQPHLEAAGLQLALVMDHLQKISCADGPSRLHMLDMIRPCFVALCWLQAECFADKPQVAGLIEELEKASEELAHLGGGEVNWTAGMGPRTRCPVCGQKLAAAGENLPHQYLDKPEKRCPPCLQAAVHAFNRLRTGFEGGWTDLY